MGENTLRIPETGWTNETTAHTNNAGNRLPAAGAPVPGTKNVAPPANQTARALRAAAARTEPSSGRGGGPWGSEVPVVRPAPQHSRLPKGPPRPPQLRQTLRHRHRMVQRQRRKSRTLQRIDGLAQRTPAIAVKNRHHPPGPLNQGERKSGRNPRCSTSEERPVRRKWKRESTGRGSNDA